MHDGWMAMRGVREGDAALIPAPAPRRQPGEDSMMLVCEACDKGYHTFCMEPAIEGLPADSWKCKVRPVLAEGGTGVPSHLPLPTPDVPLPPPVPHQNCRVCSDCGRRPAGLDPGCQWYQSYSVCEGCQQRRTAEDVCGVPAHTPQPDPPAQT